jgi:hypothetical protein
MPFWRTKIPEAALVILFLSFRAVISLSHGHSVAPEKKMNDPLPRIPLWQVISK